MADTTQQTAKQETLETLRETLPDRTHMPP